MFMVTWFNGVEKGATGLNVLQNTIFDSEGAARTEAETLVGKGAQEVRVWELIGNVNIVKSIIWS